MIIQTKHCEKKNQNLKTSIQQQFKFGLLKFNTWSGAGDVCTARAISWSMI